jgi:hypothetical protein
LGVACEEYQVKLPLWVLLQFSSDWRWTAQSDQRPRSMTLRVSIKLQSGTEESEDILKSGGQI